MKPEKTPPFFLREALPGQAFLQIWSSSSSLPASDRLPRSHHPAIGVDVVQGVHGSRRARLSRADQRLGERNHSATQWGGKGRKHICTEVQEDRLTWYGTSASRLPRGYWVKSSFPEMGSIRPCSWVIPTSLKRMGWRKLASNIFQASISKQSHSDPPQDSSNKVSLCLDGPRDYSFLWL